MCNDSKLKVQFGTILPVFNPSQTPWFLRQQGWRQTPRGNSEILKAYNDTKINQKCLKEHILKNRFFWLKVSGHSKLNAHSKLNRLASILSSCWQGLSPTWPSCLATLSALPSSPLLLGHLHPPPGNYSTTSHELILPSRSSLCCVGVDFYSAPLSQNSYCLTRIQAKSQVHAVQHGVTLASPSASREQQPWESGHLLSPFPHSPGHSVRLTNSSLYFNVKAVRQVDRLYTHLHLTDWNSTC